MIRPAMIFQDHMILQRRKPIRIWGECAPDGEVCVTFLGQSAATHSAGGKWLVELPAMEAVEDAEMLLTLGTEQLLIQHASVGEVWLAAGQSNMEFYLRYDKERGTAAENPAIRMFDCPKVSYEGELEDYDYSAFGFWRPCTEANLDYFSATAYYFAMRVQENQKVPVGIVGCTWGGTPACAWMDPEYLRENEGRAWLEEYEHVLKDLDPAAYEEHFANNPDNYKGKPFENVFLEKMMYGMSFEELMACIQENAAAGVPAFIPMEGPKSEKRPGGLYETMLRKVVPYSLRGVIWYQGENDDKRPEIYHTVFQSLIKCWRNLWQEELPFLFVQLAPFRYWMEEGEHIFPLLRREQQWVRDHTPRCWMASIMDAGMENDIHPKNKRPVGERLALLALGHVYGEDTACDPPEFAKAQMEGDTLTLHFIHTGVGLVLRGKQIAALDIFVDGERLAAYQQVIHSDTVVIRALALQTGKQIRVSYAQESYCEVNLYNSKYLTVLPFEWSFRKDR